MAGLWIKMRTDIQTDPAVIRLGAVLGLDPFAVIGRLAAVWMWADTHADRHGHVTLVSRECLDSITLCAGFGAALESVGWLESAPAEGGGITFPRFDRHMGEGAKARALAAKRKKKQREKDAAERHARVPKASRAERDISVTREEESREEKSNTEEPPSEVSSEPLPAASEPPVMSFPVTGKEKQWHLSPGKLGEYEQTYPTLDVAAALRAARQWCIDNGAKRKTHRGMPAFCSRWLEACVNRGQHLKTGGAPATLPFRGAAVKRSALDVVAEFQAKLRAENAPEGTGT